MLGYSAWPGWFPWKVAEAQGIFEEVGVEVELTWFDDYLASLTALSAGQLDGNSQTLNDTPVGVSAGDDQVVVLVNDNSAGNDAIIVDESITSIEQLAGKTVAAEPGVVDHFLLLQGLDSVGLTEEDITFHGLPTPDAAAVFSGGEFDATGVFAGSARPSAASGCATCWESWACPSSPTGCPESCPAACASGWPSPGRW